MSDLHATKERLAEALELERLRVEVAEFRRERAARMAMGAQSLMMANPLRPSPERRSLAAMMAYAQQPFCPWLFVF